MFKIGISFLAALLAMFVSVGCQKQNSGIKQVIRADSEIAHSFGISKNPLVQISSEDLKANRAFISINRNALEKEFLLRGSMIQQLPVAMFSGLQSRVVLFRERDGFVYLIEATQGHSSVDDLPQNIILTSFPIIKEENDWLTFDFNLGMSKLYVASAWHYQEETGTTNSPQKQFQAVKVQSSYIESAEFMDSGLLYIRQISSLVTENKDRSDRDSYIPTEVRYYLSPYLPNGEFKPTKSSLEKTQFGYFEIAPRIDENGVNQVFASKFNHQNKIHYYWSENTPQEFKDAVKEGILYWNKAFGTEVIHASEAPAGISAPHPKYNLVQWIDWDLAGFAYADAQADPRTGEILNSQIFMTSAFGFTGKQKAKRLIAKIDQQERVSQIGVGLKGFLKDHFCEYPYTRNFSRELSKILATGVDDKRILEIARDYVRIVVAHEVGHTLGLRHNFAGSLGANYLVSDRQNLLNYYLKNGEGPNGTITSSSVMEYSDFIDDLIGGKHVQDQNLVFEYDIKSIQNLYNHKAYDQKDSPLYCSDSFESEFVDCVVFDAGRSSPEFASWYFSDMIEALPMRLVDLFIQAKAPMKGLDPKPLEEVKLPKLDATVKSLLTNQYKYLSVLTNKGNVLKVQRRYPAKNELNREEIRAAEINFLEEELARFGGVEKIFVNLPSDFVSKLSRKFNDLISSEAYRKGKGFADQDYEFSASEIQMANLLVQKYLKKFEETFKIKRLELLAGKTFENLNEHGQFEDGQLAGIMSQFLAKTALEVLLTTTGQTIDADLETGDGDSRKLMPVRLPIFKYSQEERALATQFLNAKRSIDPTWSLYERAEVSTQFKKVITGALSVDVNSVSPTKLSSKQAARWIIENRKLLEGM